jgi:hypothetical protein
MFGQELSSWHPNPGLLSAARTAFTEVTAVVQLCQNEGAVKRGSPRNIAQAAWAMAHGLFLWLIDRRFRGVDHVRTLAESAAQIPLDRTEFRKGPIETALHM